MDVFTVENLYNVPLADIARLLNDIYEHERLRKLEEAAKEQTVPLVTLQNVLLSKHKKSIIPKLKIRKPYVLKLRKTQICKCGHEKQIRALRCRVCYNIEQRLEKETERNSQHVGRNEESNS